MIIKVCGMKEAGNIELVDTLMPDIMGFIFFPSSPRCVSNDFVMPQINAKKAGVFVNASLRDIEYYHGRYNFDYIQLHGNEDIAFCKQLGHMKIRMIKAFRVDGSFDFESTLPFATFSEYFLFDTKGKMQGGNGVKFDWARLEEYKGETPFLLSGGINNSDGLAIRSLQHPKMAGIDLNSAFEINAGIKNVVVLKYFIDEIRDIEA